MNVYDVGALAGLGTGAVLAFRGRVGLGVACMAAGGGVWILGRRMAAAAAAQGQPVPQASPFADPRVISPVVSSVVGGASPVPAPTNIPFQIVPGTDAPQTALATAQYQAWLNHIATLPAGAPLPPPPPPNVTTYTPPAPPPPPSAYVQGIRNGKVISYVPQPRSGPGRF